MKLQILSDLHHEFGILDFPIDDCDILIIAGDVNLGNKGINWLIENIPNIPVLYVLGNHEYYKGSYPKTLNKIQVESKGTNVTVLENESIVIEGTTFHGTTLWTDFSIFGSPIEYGNICQGKMNDYRKIRRDPSYSKLRTIDTYNIHKISLGWLEESLTNSSTSKNIVISHHAPSIQSVPLNYREDPITSAYASNLESFVLKHQPQFWIHGHIHTPCNYRIGETNVICNPQGYVDEKYNGYEKELIMEL